MKSMRQISAWSEISISELHEPMPEGVTQEALKAAMAAAMDAAILPALGGDRSWNTLRWWTWNQRVGRSLQSTSLVSPAPDGCSKRPSRPCPLHGGKAIGPAVQTAALEAWRQAHFGGTDAVHDGTQTSNDGEGAEGNLDQDTPDVEQATTDEPGKRKAKHRQRRWIGLHGITEAEARALETDSFLDDLGEIDAMPTLPLPTAPDADSADAETLPCAPVLPDAGNEGEPPAPQSSPTRPASEDQGGIPDSSPASRRRRRMHRGNRPVTVLQHTCTSNHICRMLHPSTQTHGRLRPSRSRSLRQNPSTTQQAQPPGKSSQTCGKAPAGGS